MGVEAQHETSRGHDLAQQGLLGSKERAGVQGNVTVAGEGSHRQAGVPGLQVHRLRTHDDHRRPVVPQSGQRIEQHAPRGDINRVDGHLGHRYTCPLRSMPSVFFRRQPSSAAIHSNSACPSAGIRPLPVRQSNTT